jgi:hypothetical protein
MQSYCMQFMPNLRFNALAVILHEQQAVHAAWSTSAKAIDSDIGQAINRMRVPSSSIKLG